MSRPTDAFSTHVAILVALLVSVSVGSKQLPHLTVRTLVLVDVEENPAALDTEVAHHVSQHLAENLSRKHGRSSSVSDSHVQNLIPHQ